MASSQIARFGKRFNNESWKLSYEDISQNYDVRIKSNQISNFVPCAHQFFFAAIRYTLLALTESIIWRTLFAFTTSWCHFIGQERVNFVHIVIPIPESDCNLDAPSTLVYMFSVTPDTIQISRCIFRVSCARQRDFCTGTLKNAP